jgi:hypothetical protein
VFYGTDFRLPFFSFFVHFIKLDIFSYLYYKKMIQLSDEYECCNETEKMIWYGNPDDLKNIKDNEGTIPEICLRLGNLEMMWYTSRILKIEHPELTLSSHQLNRVKNIEAIWKKRGPKRDVSSVNIMTRLDTGTFDVGNVDREYYYIKHDREIAKYFPPLSHRGLTRIRYDDNFKGLGVELGLNMVFFSDTHGNHRLLKIPDANAVVFCGDCCEYGNVEQTLDFIQWFSSLPHKYKVFVPGNHDSLIEDFYHNKWDKIKDKEEVKKMLDNIVFLIGKSITIRNGKKKINIYGHPCVPYRKGATANAFAIHRSKMKENVDIPKDTDVIVTHFPPWGIGDYNTQITGDYTGDSGDLYCVVYQRE